MGNIKILYAAGNRLGSYFQAKRFLDSIKHKNYNIKIAAYKLSLGNMNADYMLDSLLNFTNPNEISFNGNYTYYYNEIKRFAPDIVISDFDIYTSIIALELNIKLWQFSPINLYYAMNNEVKYNIGIHKKYFHLLDSNNKRNGYITNILNNSDKRFVLSHLCDSNKNNIITDNFEWIRPNFILEDGTKKTDYLIVLPKPNKNIIFSLKEKQSILFSSFAQETYNNIEVIDILKENDYNKCIEKCNHYVSDGTAVFLADAFYNQKYCISFPRYDDIETIIGSMTNEYYGFGSSNYNETYKINIEINNKVKFISEHLGQL